MATTKFRDIASSEIYAAQVIDLVNRIGAISGLGIKSINIIVNALLDVNPKLNVNGYGKLFIPANYNPVLFEAIYELMMKPEEKN